MKLFKRSAILLVCMVLLFGNLFIPVSARTICPLCKSATGQQTSDLYRFGADASYCSHDEIHTQWTCCWKWMPVQIVNEILHDFPQPIALYHVACKKNCGQTKCVGSACLQCW